LVDVGGPVEFEEHGSVSFMCASLRIEIMRHPDKSCKPKGT
jgi:hypothetical protein